MVNILILHWACKRNELLDFCKGMSPVTHKKDSKTKQKVAQWFTLGDTFENVPNLSFETVNKQPCQTNL